MNEENKVEKYLTYFNETVHENEEDIITICEAASVKIWDQIRIKFGKKADDAKLIGVMFAKTYDAIIKTLQGLEGKKNYEEINFCDRFVISVSTTEDEESEKLGNFMISITDTGKIHKDIEMDDADEDKKSRAVFWNTQNVKENPEIIREISMEAIKKLNEIDVFLEAYEFIPPFFSIVYDSIINYIKVKRREKDAYEFEVYFMSCFYIGARESDDGVDDIYIRPNIESKLGLKNDEKATAKND